MHDKYNAPMALSHYWALTRHTHVGLETSSKASLSRVAQFALQREVLRRGRLYLLALYSTPAATRNNNTNVERKILLTII